MVIRKKMFIDRSVQGTLLARVFVYWAILLVYFMLGSSCFQYYEHPEWSFSRHLSVWFESIWPWIPSAVLMLPLVMHDVVRLSHRFVGPIHRLRNQMQEIIKKPDCTALSFRDDDYWQELAEPINQLQSEVLALRLALASTKKTLSDTLAEQAQAKFLIDGNQEQTKQEDSIGDGLAQGNASDGTIDDNLQATDESEIKSGGADLNDTDLDNAVAEDELSEQVEVPETQEGLADTAASAEEISEQADESEEAAMKEKPAEDEISSDGKGTAESASDPVMPPIDVSPAVAGGEATAGAQ